MERAPRDLADWWWLIQYQRRQVTGPPTVHFYKCRAYTRADAARMFTRDVTGNPIQCLCFCWKHTEPIMSAEGYPTNPPHVEGMNHVYEADK